MLVPAALRLLGREATRGERLAILVLVGIACLVAG
jgi:hypothetical protein